MFWVTGKKKQQQKLQKYKTRSYLSRLLIIVNLTLLFW